MLLPTHGQLYETEYHDSLVTALNVLFWAIYYGFPSWLLTLHDWVPIVVSLAPLTLLWLNPIVRGLGPRVTGDLTMTLVGQPVVEVTRFVSWISFDNSLGPYMHWLLRIFLGFVVHWICNKVAELSFLCWSVFTYLLQITCRLYLLVAIGLVYSILLRSRFLIWTVLPLLHSSILNLHSASPLAVWQRSRQTEAEGFSLLTRRESLSGALSVLEDNKAGHRFLRQDHTILGGILRPEDGVSISTGKSIGYLQHVGDPTDALSIMLEAVRLVEDDESRDSPGFQSKSRFPDAGAQALFL